jgi:membrane-associated phospholipid phosphatase
MTGLARIHVGAHLPLDVVGGLAIGTLAADGIDALLDARSNRASVR